MLGRFLELEGFHVETAANGRQALDRLSSGLNASVIVLDLMMPVMDGWQFRREQVRNAALASIPVIVVSAAGKERMASIDANAYLSKPVDLEQLLARGQSVFCCTEAAPRALAVPVSVQACGRRTRHVLAQPVETVLPAAPSAGRRSRRRPSGTASRRRLETRAVQYPRYTGIGRFSFTCVSSLGVHRLFDLLFASIPADRAARTRASASGLLEPHAAVAERAARAREQRVGRRVVQVDVELVREHELHEPERVLRCRAAAGSGSCVGSRDDRSTTGSIRLAARVEHFHVLRVAGSPDPSGLPAAFRPGRCPAGRSSTG